MEHYVETGEVLGKGTDSLEGYTLQDKGYFGPGHLPTHRHSQTHPSPSPSPPRLSSIHHYLFSHSTRRDALQHFYYTLSFYRRHFRRFFKRTILEL
jgi:hypothetical protein